MSAVTLRLGGGATETVVRDADGRVIAVVTRPCAGAKWFLHRMSVLSSRGEKFPSLQAAVVAALEAA